MLAAAEKRGCFSEAQRERLDRLTTQVRGVQRGANRVEVGAVREAESTFHPMRDIKRS